MYIRVSDEATVKSLEFVSVEEMIATVYNCAPTVVKSGILRYDFFNYIATIPDHCNDIILNGVMSNFDHIIDHYFIEVVEDSSFDYEYGDICDTHHQDVTVGYVPRTPEYEKMACEGPWDDDYFWK